MCIRDRLVTVLGVLALGVVEVPNLGPCPEVVTALGELVLRPAECVTNLGAVLVTVDGVLGCGVGNL